MSNYSRIRQAIYNEIERERQLKIIHMCKKCPFYIAERCSTDRCVNEVRRSVCNENSKTKSLRIKRGRV